MSPLFTFLLLLTARPALATEFVLSTDAIRAQYPAQAAATESFFPLGENVRNLDGMRCTVFFVGKNGEAITAPHCVERILASKPNIDRFYDQEALQAFDRGVFTKYRLKRTSLPLEARYWVSSGNSTEILPVFEVLWSQGPGFVTRYLEKNYFNENPTAAVALRAEGYNSWGDLVLIRLPNSKDHACVKVKSPESQSAQKVFSFSFPGMTRDICPPSTSGLSHVCSDIQTFTRGELIYERNDIIEKLQSHKYIDKTDTANSIDFLVPQKIALSDIDGVGGSSGSPVFEEEGGAMVGIVYSILRPNAYDTSYYPYSTQVTPLTPEMAKAIKRLVPSNEECGEI